MPTDAWSNWKPEKKEQEFSPPIQPNPSISDPKTPQSHRFWLPPTLKLRRDHCHPKRGDLEPKLHHLKSGETSPEQSKKPHDSGTAVHISRVNRRQGNEKERSKKEKVKNKAKSPRPEGGEKLTSADDEAAANNYRAPPCPLFGHRAPRPRRATRAEGSMSAAVGSYTTTPHGAFPYF
jgi:hypothetical protein